MKLVTKSVIGIKLESIGKNNNDCEVHDIGLFLV